MLGMRRDFITFRDDTESMSLADKKKRKSAIFAMYKTWWPQNLKTQTEEELRRANKQLGSAISQCWNFASKPENIWELILRYLQGEHLGVGQDEKEREEGEEEKTPTKGKKKGKVPVKVDIGSWGQLSHIHPLPFELQQQLLVSFLGGELKMAQVREKVMYLKSRLYLESLLLAHTQLKQGANLTVDENWDWARLVVAWPVVETPALYEKLRLTVVNDDRRLSWLISQHKPLEMPSKTLEINATMKLFRSI
jgi:hypothetical protein